MWKFLYRLASPSHFYALSCKWAPRIGFVALTFLLIGTFWGLFIAPGDYQQGDAMRIIYVHVPSAFMSMALYTYMSFLAILLLVWRIKIAGLLMKLIAPLGASMTFLALLSGSLWGKPMWGTWWIWDARLTSELLLLFIYIAIMALDSSFSNRKQAQKAVAILVLVGLVDLPIIHYSVNWWNTLHQASTLSLFHKPKIATPMLIPLLMMFVGFFLFSVWILLKNAASELLELEKKSLWVKTLMMRTSG